MLNTNQGPKTHYPKGVKAFWYHLASVFYLLPKKWQNQNKIANQLKASEHDKFIVFILLTMIELIIHFSWYTMMIMAERHMDGVPDIIVDDVAISLKTFAFALLCFSILIIGGVLKAPESGKRWLWLQGSYVMMYVAYGLCFTFGFGENTSAVGVMFLGGMVLGLFLLRWRFILTAYILSLAALTVFLVSQKLNYFSASASLYPDELVASHPLWQLSYLYLSIPKVTLTILSVAQVLRVLEFQEDTIYRLSEVDALTEAYNRRSVYAYFNFLWRYRKAWHAVSVIYFDLDKFKNVNDTFGHPVGDKVLVNAVKTVRPIIPENAILGRLGGEEFIVILPNIERQEALLYAEQIHKNIQTHPVLLDNDEHIHLNNNQQWLRVTASLGVCTLYRDSQVPITSPRVSYRQYLRSFTAVLLDLPIAFDKLVHRADEAMYEAKTTGRNRIVIATAMKFKDKK